MDPKFEATPRGRRTGGTMTGHAKSSRPNLRRSQIALRLISAALIVSIVSTNLIFLSDLRESTLRTTEANLKRYNLTLAEEADRSFKSLDLVLSSVSDYLARRGVTDSDSYQRTMSDQETHALLKEKVTGLPQIDAVTMIDAKGKLINFSRYWPIPDINVSDRDYFKALSSDENLETYISAPTQNRGNGTWNIYLARRLNDPDGNFMGLLLGAMSQRYFENFFAATAPESDTKISLVRSDDLVLASYPHSAKTGQLKADGGRRALQAGGSLRETSEDGHKSHKTILRSARMLPNYPVLVTVTLNEESELRNWHGMAKLLLAMSIISGLIILTGSVAIARWWNKQALYAEAAEATSASKSNFLAMMSHEIRTPMNAVLGLASNLLETKLAPEQRRAVEGIHSSGDGLLKILDDILEYSRLEAGRLSIELITFSPINVVKQSLDMIGPRAAAKGLTIRTDLSDNLPQALIGDPGRIRQVLLNLLSNAVKFTPSGTIVVAVNCVSDDRSTARIQWTVTDTGIGIDPDKIESLFDDFVQADNSIRRRFGGSGLGLAISRRLIEQMGGSINVTSTPGVGSSFNFTLALAITSDVAPKEESPTGVTDLHARIAAGGRPLRLLIVDDNPTNRAVAVQMLSEFAIQCSTACDGTEAVTAATRFEYDVILMDMRMPEMDGLEATRSIRARGGPLATVPIIAFTANAFAEDEQACRDAGMNDHVAKPVRKNALVSAILSALPPLQARNAADVGLPVVASEPTPSGDVGRDIEGRPEVGSVACPIESAPTARLYVGKAAFAHLVAEIGEQASLDVLAVFVRDAEAKLGLLDALNVATDRRRIEREAHSLKSAAGTFGLDRLAGLARDLERRAPELSEADYVVLVAQIKTTFAAAQRTPVGDDELVEFVA
ncbi:Hpt sensor hybrid histidine kinase [Rhodopseudomonas pseudopalustris]|uniref:histidine kinase n=2 Tax=Rhodopseudomonas pseudopalustris TaxID=1513892 RepID=A0A1H8PD52_9BRAD|nr:Hpt sensor hybrid histidine kinase [Rhodopseudomonas pseudopalustris]